MAISPQPTAKCGKCGREMDHVSYDSYNPSRTTGICPEHGVMYANPAEYVGEN